MKLSSLTTKQEGSNAQYYNADALGTVSLDADRLVKAHWFVYAVNGSDVTLLEMTKNIRRAARLIITDNKDNFLRSKNRQIVSGQSVLDYLTRHQLMIDEIDGVAQVICS